MSRFEKFQHTQVSNREKEPLNEQIFINDCIINFENGFITNKCVESEDEIYPAIECCDAHIEYWENGVLNRNNAPAVISGGDNRYEFWENGKKTQKNVPYYPNDKSVSHENGIKAEKDFAKYLNRKEKPFIHLDQCDDYLYAKVFIDNKIKRPDYLIFEDEKPFFIDVKATKEYTLDKNDLDRITNLKNKYSIDVIFAMTYINIDDGEYKDYSFLSLPNISNYLEILKKDIPGSNNWDFYTVPKGLLNDKMIHDEVENKKLIEIFTDEKKQYIEKKYYYSDSLFEYISKNGYAYSEK